MALHDTPWRLSPDNFTPPERTPWGGTEILRLKSHLALAPDKAAYRCVGESWEISTDAQFPSRIINHGNITLREAAPDLPFLVKILDTAEPLSVQVHPSNDFPGLKAGECGKPEAWFIYDAKPGAGVYLGFREGVTKEQVRACLAANGPMNELMEFVPVKRGDVFEIAPGLVHAIGPGVTLVEPQAVLPGKSGVTYRFWDWNRLYDGKPRQLHVEESLAVMDLQATARSARRDNRVEHAAFNAAWSSAPGPRLTAFVVMSGYLGIGASTFHAGESFILPAGTWAVDAADAWVVSVT